MKTLTDDVLSAIIKGKKTSLEIARFTLANRNSVKSAIGRLAARGEIIRESRGSYIPSPSSFSEPNGWYLSGLQYERNIGFMIFGDYEDFEAQPILIRAAEQETDIDLNFWGLASIPYEGQPLDEVIKVNL